MAVSAGVIKRLAELEDQLRPEFEAIDRIAFTNQTRMLEAFQAERIGSHHFHSSTGYGYHDPGREALERVWARVFETESALVRQQLVSGTHAIGCGLFGNLNPGDELVIASGFPYPTLAQVLGLDASTNRSVCPRGDFKITTIDLKQDGTLDLTALRNCLKQPVKMVFLQRSCGYSDRPALSIKELAGAGALIKKTQPETVILVDNCYGEFVEAQEPTMVGVDLVAGSLIKNPGGCLAPSGGYLAGRGDLVARAAARLYLPELGAELGPSLLNLRLFFQGFFEAPHRVGEMVKGAVLAAALFADQGFRVAPQAQERRSDIIQRIYLGSAPELIEFCQAVQASSPLEFYLNPEPAQLPGYRQPVVMGGGSFIAGSTSEFSVDGPLLPPYIAFLQGGLSYTQIRLALATIITKKYFLNKG